MVTMATKIPIYQDLEKNPKTIEKKVKNLFIHPYNLVKNVCPTDH